MQSRKTDLGLIEPSCYSRAHHRAEYLLHQYYNLGVIEDAKLE
jgi:hypothetical protein